MSELKVKKLGKAGYMICIGADGTNGEWYFMTPIVKDFITSSGIKEGDIVEIEFQKTDKKINLTRINKVGQVGPQTAPAQERTYTQPSKSNFGVKSPADNAVIVRQSVGHMTSRILAGMMTSGIITVAEVPQQMDIIYKKFQELVG